MAKDIDDLLRAEIKKVQAETDQILAKRRATELRKELAKAQNRVRETKAELAQAEKEAKGGN